ncbi:hypothetical protein ACRTDU_03905 [Sunxiuqinia elliptica]
MDFIEKNFKYMVWLAALIVLLVLFFSFRKKAKAEETNPTDNLDIDEQSVAITENQALIIAENLLAAMNRYGSDTEAILENLQGLNKDDLLLVIKKFGNKPYNGAGLATRAYEIAFFSQNLNLIGWLRSDLANNKNTLNEVKQIFNSNGINF